MTGQVLQRPPREPLVAPGGFELLDRDMTATFSADCTLGFAQEKLAGINQWFAIDGDPDSTLGALIEKNSSGPLRLGFGAWRDLLLGLQFTNGKGELITAGGKAVKNVAGYDLTKFMIGQHGIFGRVLTLTTRTYLEPAGAILARWNPDPAILAAMLPTHLKPQWSLLTRDALLCGYLSDATTLGWYDSNLKDRSPSEIVRRSLKEDTEHRNSLWQTETGASAFRASVPPSRLKDFTGKLIVEKWVADPAFGIVIGTATETSTPDALRSAASACDGAVRFGTSADVLDVSTNPAERQIIERLKTAFDPDNQLEPLPWQRR